MSCPAPALASRQAAIGIDVALETGEEHRTRPLSEEPGVMRCVEQVGSDAAAKR